MLYGCLDGCLKTQSQQVITSDRCVRQVAVFAFSDGRLLYSLFAMCFVLT